METRAILVAFICLLFWLAPSPQSSEAHIAAKPPAAVGAVAVNNRMTVTTANISIKPYNPADHEK